MSQQTAYATYMRAVDTKMATAFGMTSDDVEDFNWYDFFDDDLDIDDAASEAVAMWAYDHGFDGSPSTYAEESK